MSELFFVSDTHFNHANMLTFTNTDGSKVRDFASVDEMNETMIERWNAKVGKRDTVWHLGDVFFGPEAAALALLRRLNGNVNLILGNHDHVTPDFIAFFGEIHTWRKWKKHNLFLSHFPLHPTTLNELYTDSKVVNVHGHIHGSQAPTPLMGVPGGPKKWVNISIEHTNYAPLSFDELKARF